jgi:hypothetical protein
MPPNVVSAEFLKLSHNCQSLWKFPAVASLRYWG